jgi:hypothetical protein
MPDRAVVALDIGVLLRLTGLDVLDGDALFLGPFSSLPLMYSGPLSTLMVPGLPRHSMILSRLRMTRSAGSEKSTSMPSPSRLKSSSTFSSRNCRPSPSRSAMKSIDQVMLGASGTASSIGFVPLQPLAGLDPQVQFQRAIDAVDAFVVPGMALHVAQVQETQAEPPGLAGIGQPDQQIGDLFVLVLQLRAVAIAGLADPEGPAGQRDADPRRATAFSAISRR